MRAPSESHCFTRSARRDCSIDTWHGSWSSMAGTAPVDDHSSNGTSLLIWASYHARMHGKESGPSHCRVSGRSHHELRARNARYVRERSGFLADRRACWTGWSRWGGQWLRISR